MLSRDNERAETAIELKWAGSTLPTRQRLLDDLFRLECVRNRERQGMARYFLLAGTADGVRRVLDWQSNVGGGRTGFTSFLLRDAPDRNTVEVAHGPDHLRPYIKSFHDGYQVQPARRFYTTRAGRAETPSLTVLIWRITSMKGRRVFDAVGEWADVEVPDIDEAEADDSGEWLVG